MAFELEGWKKCETEMPDTAGWYHILIKYENKEQGRIEYTVENDYFYKEDENKYNYIGAGFCKAGRWLERETVVAWHKYPEISNLSDIPNCKWKQNQKELPTVEGWYHILTKYESNDIIKHEQSIDLYSIDLARKHKKPIGFVSGRHQTIKGKKCKIIAWHPYPHIPNLLTKDATKIYQPPGCIIYE